ncbi:MAG: class II fructose-bisphosphate aldolase [Clostridia bacterium]|nr:class II fructose-bisphosphate aldolase [Clostridia bacterium]
MLVNLNDIVKLAEAGNFALGTFNGPNFESIKAVINAAEELDQPVVLTHAQLHEDWNLCTIDEIGPLMLFMADKAKVPVCVHLDHGTDLDYIKRGLEIGFTSVMYDGSAKSLEENAANTSIVVKMAHAFDASVEAEVGSMGARDLGKGNGGDGSIHTDPEVAKWFVEQTGCDALACAFGTVHGLYTKEPKLDFDRVRKIREAISVPIVMHGGSGVSDEDYEKVIEAGVRKINYYTYMGKAGANAVAAMEDKTYFHDMAKVAELAMKEDVKRAISVFSRLI